MVAKRNTLHQELLGGRRVFNPPLDSPEEPEHQ
ncbi:hypothetical protein T06_12421 [Trichinella sp. T6]|nr:hypothetical protein T06_12421 [Trichinella sp. T6]